MQIKAALPADRVRIDHLPAKSDGNETYSDCKKEKPCDPNEHAQSLTMQILAKFGVIS
jgi:hypothetical protein